MELKALTAENAPARAAAFLRDIPVYPNSFSGRGIVISAGGVRYLTCAWVLIHMLRRLGCTLPIEVWYLGEEERDPHWIKLVEPLGVRCVDAREVSRNLPCPHKRLDGWESKAFAILHCPFQEVLLLDADNVPVVDPTFLFETPEYRVTGAIFWPDCNKAGPSHHSWRAFDVTPRDEWEQESGQMVIDKRRSWAALCLCDWYNRHSDFYYQYVYGDKDTFRLAWHRAGFVYAMPERIPSGGLAIRQADFTGRLIFQHRHEPKWSLYGNRRHPGFLHQDDCLGFLRELAACWNPMSSRLQRLSAADQGEMARWAGQDYHFSLMGRRRWPIRLLRQGLIAGDGPSERYWWFEAGRLMLSRLNRSPVLALERRSAARWQGRSPHYGGAEVCVTRTRYTRAAANRGPALAAV